MPEVLAIIVGLIIILVPILIAVLLFFGSEWKETLKSKLDSLDDSNNSDDLLVLKTNLIEIDDLLGFALKKLHIVGDTLEEQLENVKELLEKNLYDEIWQAHNVRNKIVQDKDSSLRKDTVRKAFESIKDGIKRLV